MTCRALTPVRCLAVLAIAGLALVALDVAGIAAKAPGPWVFSYFLDNGQDGLHLAYSRDGLTWALLGGGQPFLAPTVGGKLMRDSCIMLGLDSVFYAVWTIGWWE